MEDIVSYINPELLVLVPVLCLVGMAIKRYGSDNRVIPLVLGLIGMLLACLYGIATMTASESVAMVLFTGIVQGILCAAASVYAHQSVHQWTKEA
ncbi:MAG: hypothetical protein IKQ60_06475 [Candidatus Methanomethylophilaceae archaeon]|nr:hypothetical protein [Candidatus Methanomethylophilaceae archaeon]